LRRDASRTKANASGTKRERRSGGMRALSSRGLSETTTASLAVALRNALISAATGRTLWCLKRSPWCGGIAPQVGSRHFDVQLIGGLALHNGKDRRDADGPKARR